MPGNNDGSDSANAFDWDFSQFPGGTRVFGNTATNQRDFWAVELQAGQEYDIQTRLPRDYDTFLYLYDIDGLTLLRTNDDGGEDGDCGNGGE